MAKTHTFRTEIYNKPTKPNEKFESDEEELYPIEYRDILNNCIVKLNPFLKDDFQSESLKGYFQGDKLLLTIANKLGHIKKEWLIQRLRTQLHTLDPSDPLDRNDAKKIKNKKCWFVVSEEAFKDGGTHFHVFICLSERKQKILEQLQNIFKLENEFVTATPFVRAIKGKNWDYALRYVLKEDRTPFCSLGSARLLTYLNNLDSGSLKENDNIKKLIKAIINESEFLKPEDIKSKEELRSEVSEVSLSDIDINPSIRVLKEDKIQIKKLETENLYNDNSNQENSLVFLCDDGGRFKLEILNKMGDFITFIDKNFNLLSKKDVMKPGVQINLNGDINYSTTNYYGLEKKELSNLKKEIREELREELRQELIVEMTNEMTAKIKKEVSNELKLKLNLFAEVKAEIKEEIKEELKEELKADLMSFDKRRLS
jgi:hypothetical protein